MFTRTANPTTSGPEREQLDGEKLCPPHDFSSAWGSPIDASDHDDTVPVMLCAFCGEVRALKLLG